MKVEAAVGCGRETAMDVPQRGENFHGRERCHVMRIPILNGILRPIEKVRSEGYAMA